MASSADTIDNVPAKIQDKGGMQIFVTKLKGKVGDMDEHEHDVDKALAKMGKRPLEEDETITGDFAITLDVDTTDTMDDLKDKILDKKGIESDQVEELHLIYNGKQIKNGTLRSYGVEKASTLHMILRLRGGMAKKGVTGVKKTTKAEKMFMVRGKAQFSAQQPLQVSGVSTVISLIESPNFFATTVKSMTFDQVASLRAAIDGIKKNDPKDIIEVVGQHFAERLRNCKNDAAKLQNSIQAVEESMIAQFTEEFFVGAQYDYNKF